MLKFIALVFRPILESYIGETVTRSQMMVCGSALWHTREGTNGISVNFGILVGQKKIIHTGLPPLLFSREKEKINFHNAYFFLYFTGVNILSYVRGSSVLELACIGSQELIFKL